jgi:hypothetical protein
VTGTSLPRRRPPPELPSMHSRHPSNRIEPEWQPRVTDHALGTASRNAGGVSRHPSNIPLPKTGPQYADPTTFILKAQKGTTYHLGPKEPRWYAVGVGRGRQFTFSHFPLRNSRPIRAQYARTPPENKNAGVRGTFFTSFRILRHLV